MNDEPARQTPYCPTTESALNRREVRPVLDWLREVRTVTFANGMGIDERILDVDDERRRVAYVALNGSGMEYHHASMQILDGGPGRCQFLWITDVHPTAVVANHAAHHQRCAGAQEEPRETLVRLPTLAVRRGRRPRVARASSWFGGRAITSVIQG